MYAAISADIVSSSFLSNDSMVELHERLEQCLYLLGRRYEGFWGRITRGDSIECMLDHPEDAFEVAIILKAWVKAFEPQEPRNLKYFNRYGLRLAIGIDHMKMVDRHLGIMNGEAIYRSGRTLNSLVGHSKYSFTISMANFEHEEPLQVIFSLVNQLLNNATARQCETIHERILAANASRTAEKLGISVSGVNQTLNTVGWNAIEQSILYYRRILKDYVW